MPAAERDSETHRYDISSVAWALTLITTRRQKAIIERGLRILFTRSRLPRWMRANLAAPAGQSEDSLLIDLDKDRNADYSRAPASCRTGKQLTFKWQNRIGDAPLMHPRFDGSPRETMTR